MPPFEFPTRLILTLDRSTCRVVLFTLLVGTWLTAPTQATACSCVEGDLTGALETAAAVFEGSVESVELTEDQKDHFAQRVARFRVVRVWKGSQDEEALQVYTARDSALCGFDFRVGESYLVFAQESAGKLRVNLCSRTRPIQQAEEDLAALGAGITPVDIRKAKPQSDEKVVQDALEPPKDGGCASCGALDASAEAGMLWSLAALMWAVRRRTA